MEEIQIADSKNAGAGGALSSFGSELKLKADKCCADRKLIEERWVADMRQFMGQYEPAVLSAITEGRSKVFVNLTRPKTLKGVAQLVDMLFPADDKNWGATHTPVPELMEQSKSDKPAEFYDQCGQAVNLQFSDDQTPVTEGDVAKAEMEKAEAAAQKMEAEIEDQLVECDYNAECRKMIRYAGILGTGVICGPEVEQRENSSWQRGENGEFIGVFNLDRKPIVRFVPTWDFFPDMSASNIEECDFVFERTYMSKKKMRNLKRIPGVIKENLDDLLELYDAKSTQHYSEHVSQLREMSGIASLTEDNRYELWRYRGPIKRDLLVEQGIIEGDPEAIKKMPSEFDGIAIFCADKVLKVSINPMQSEDWPYSVFCWHKDDNCIFGYGIPYEARQPQAVINTAWRLMLDNASRSSGPQIVRSRAVKQMDNSDEIYPWKEWEISDPAANVNDAFKFFEFPNRQVEMANIFNLAKSLMDEETGLPAIAQGEQGQVTPTLGGMSMLMNAANTTRRDQVKQFDDDVTVPMIKRFYDWNMQFNTKKEIKGDMKVYARGTSALLVKEQQAQALFTLVDKYASHPVYGPMFSDNGYDGMRKAVMSMHISPDDILKNKDTYLADLKSQQEAQAKQGQQQDPRIMAEHIRGQYRMQELEAEATIHDKNNQLQYETARMKFQTELAKMANDRQISLDQLQADLKKTGWKLDLDASFFKTELQLKQIDGMTANYGLDPAHAH